MAGDELYVVASATWLPQRMSIEDAIAAGMCDQRTAMATGVSSVAIAGSEHAPEMAARAAESAMRRGGVQPDDVDVLLHASFYYQGHDLWAPASYVQRRAMSTATCPAISVGQVSNGGMAALELARAYLLADTTRSAALITTGDKFCPPGFDRFRSDPGTVYADGGTAVVLGRTMGFARLLSLASVSAPDLEGMHRGDDPFGAAPFSHRSTVDLDACKNAFLAGYTASMATARVRSSLRQVVKQALAAAEVTQADIDWFVVPHLGSRRLRTGYLGPLGIDEERTTWDYSRAVGHLGAGDPFAGLDHLVASGRAGPGDHLMLLGVGAGFTWSAAIIRIIDRPTWARGS
ncbi:ketoacyl-ACP synthase III family protein [Actinocrispum wychmicini]|uniref:3-oxoacyl-[acyl-carrier-protein] synthase-3 n=1 Tax=Actinocrispum wychmicini TaxID=1213861 RepID=A0A4R2JPE1_9PSEU|nr:ketoacyl-ACP synthase III family protein [Actinocrispum wychmicini]TCO62031.1 3-oxoacyl-[acyl-carrier-protein] synthase-3 [Actinocrispum wychmicini]